MPDRPAIEIAGRKIGRLLLLLLLLLLITLLDEVALGGVRGGGSGAPAAAMMGTFGMDMMCDSDLDQSRSDAMLRSRAAADGTSQDDECGWWSAAGVGERTSAMA